MEDIRIKEIRRKLSLRKEKFRKEFNYVGRLFGVNVDEYLKKYDLISEKMIDVGLELKVVEDKMTNLDLEFEKLKKGLLLNENIDLKSSIEKFGNDKKYVVDELFRCGFINNDENELLLNDIWENRYRKRYSD